MTEPEPIGAHLERAIARQAEGGHAPPAALQPPDRSAARAEAHRLLVEQEWAATVPPKLAHATLDDLTDVAGGDLIRRWALEGTPPPWRDGVNLVLVGATGVGKSHAAIAATRAVVERSESCLYWSVPELFAALDWNEDDHRRVMAQAQRTTVLVLDDLGAEAPNDWTRRKLYELVNARWNANRATIATTNLDPADLEEAVGPRTYSRLAGGSIAVRLVGPDRRRTP